MLTFNYIFSYMNKSAKLAKEFDVRMPKLLYRYNDESFAVKLKIRFLYFLILAYLSATFLLLISTLLIQLIKSNFTSVKIEVLLTITTDRLK